MPILEELTERIEQALAELDLPAVPAGLYDPVRYGLEAGGKRFRPCLALMAAQMFRGETPASLPTALAMEIFHSFTLVHDDIMDAAPLRRGKASVFKKWDVNTAILSGDVMLVKAYQLLLQNTDDVVRPILAQFSRTAEEVCIGQQMDMDFELRASVDMQAYIQMITYKTAVLLGCSLYCGALSGGAREKDAASLYDAGVQLGICFQIQDDLLDAYGNAEKFGKQKGGDILRNKKTYLTVTAYALAAKDISAALHAALNSTEMPESEKIEKVIALYDTLQVRQHAQKAMEGYYNNALASLDAVQVPEDKKIALRTLASALYDRDH
ncbi:MAG: polyprenyl synthetase family protein [Chitinophagales bacterium]